MKNDRLKGGKSAALRGAEDSYPIHSEGRDSVSSKVKVSLSERIERGKKVPKQRLGGTVKGKTKLEKGGLRSRAMVGRLDRTSGAGEEEAFGAEEK